MAATPLRFIVPHTATRIDITEVFQRIGAECRRAKASRALVVTAGSLDVSPEDLRHAVSGLAEAGCSGGFRLALVAPAREVFEELVQVEDAGIRGGISARVFFEEGNARRWLDGW